jgi:hypothetical protein
MLLLGRFEKSLPTSSNSTPVKPQETATRSGKIDGEQRWASVITHYLGESPRHVNLATCHEVGLAALPPTPREQWPRLYGDWLAEELAKCTPLHLWKDNHDYFVIESEGFTGAYINLDQLRDLQGGTPTTTTTTYRPIPGSQPVHLEGALHRFLWRGAAEDEKTRDFRDKLHDDLLRALRDGADAHLPSKPRIVLMQSLQDAGCDLLIEWGTCSKYGIQLKSFFDIDEDEFAAKTMSQIQDSRQHGLKKLFVLLAGDLTDRSQQQKVRGLEARISKQNDGYVVTISPERLWTLLFGNEEGQGSTH